MSKIEKRNNEYYLINNDGTEVLVSTKIDAKTGVEWLKLPENEEGRQWMSGNKFKDTNVVDLAPHVERTVTATGTKNWMSYLTEEERTNLEEAENALESMRAEYKRNALARREAEKNVPLTPKEKLQREMARLQAKIAKLESEEA